VFLEVRAGNEVAQRLYASLGFERIAVRPRYYQPGGEDAWVMRRSAS
jgi:ribosomal protein S18 acetylase RimI-like enzyme